MDGSLASMEGRDAKTLDHGLAALGQGLATPRRPALDLQEVYQIKRTGLLIGMFGRPPSHLVMDW
jgi:hypothetical protein